MKHTKAPWELCRTLSVNPTGDSKPFMIISRAHKAICGFEYDPAGDDVELMGNVEANARLIAKSPEMYEALESIQSLMETISNRATDGYKEAEIALSIIDRVLMGII